MPNTSLTMIGGEAATAVLAFNAFVAAAAGFGFVFSGL